MVAFACGVWPEVEAPEGSGCGCGAGCGGIGFGLVPEVEGVGDECGVLVAGEVLEPELGGEARGSCGAGGAIGGAALAGGSWCCICCRWAQWLKSGNGGPIVLELGNCVFFSGQESVDVRSFEIGPKLFFRRC